MKYCYYRIGPHLVSLYQHNNPFFMPRVEALMPSLQPFRLDGCPAGERPMFMLHLTDDYSIGRAQRTEAGCFEWDEAQVVVNRVVLSARGGFHADSFQGGGGEYELAFTLRGGDATYRMLLDFRRHRVTIELSASLQGGTDSFVLTNCLLMAYSFFAIRKRTVVMHASVVTLDGRGYLFLGKSGTGKSTHSRLWLSTLPGTELLNDDNPIVHFDRATKTATVYGSPWSGKTPCYRTVSVPVGAFVRLAQAPANRIHRASGSRAMALLLPSCSSFREDPVLYNHYLNTVTALAGHLPVFQLDCLPDAAAAELCYTTLNQQRYATT